jgi:hypothetical protein
VVVVEHSMGDMAEGGRQMPHERSMETVACSVGCGTVLANQHSYGWGEHTKCRSWRFEALMSPTFLDRQNRL